MISIEKFNRDMDIFGSFVRRSTTDEAELILSGLQVQKENLISGSDEYELCDSKIFFVEQHISKRQRNQIQRGKKPWNLV